MADVTITYEYKVPNELWIDDFSEEKTREFTYSGPEVLIVTVPAGGSAYTQKLDGVVYDDETTVEINVTTNPELLVIADLLWGRPTGHEIQNEEVVNEDGQTVSEYINPTIHDYYWFPVYNQETESWPAELQLVVKDTLSPKMRTYIAKADMFISILDQFELSTDDLTLFTSYKSEVNSYKSSVTTPWKYIGTNPFELIAPKIPFVLVENINKIKASGYDQLMKD